MTEALARPGFRSRTPGVGQMLALAGQGAVLSKKRKYPHFAPARKVGIVRAGARGDMATWTGHHRGVHRTGRA